MQDAAILAQEYFQWDAEIKARNTAITWRDVQETQRRFTAFLLAATYDERYRAWHVAMHQRLAVEMAKAQEIAILADREDHRL